MAPRAVTAGSAGLWDGAGSAAARIAEFLFGRAFFPVADAGDMLVRLAARAGVFGGIFRRVDGIFLSVTGRARGCWHSGTL